MELSDFAASSGVFTGVMGRGILLFVLMGLSSFPRRAAFSLPAFLGMESSESWVSSSEPVADRVSEARRLSSLEDAEEEAPEASRRRRFCLFSITRRAKSGCFALL